MQLAYERRGSGPPLVLLHPLGADRRVWAPVLAALAREREVLALDLPGFGASPPLDGGVAPTPEGIARAVADVLGAIGLERPHVAGNSLGGWVALELALRNRARSATAIAPAGLWAQPLMPKRGLARAAARALLPLMPALLRARAGRGAALAAVAAQPERVPTADALHLVRAYATAPGFRAVNDAMRASRFLGLERVRVPVTLGWPDRDRLVRRPAHLPATVRNVVLRGCGHIPMWDDPDQVVRVLLRGSE